MEIIVIIVMTPFLISGSAQVLDSIPDRIYFAILVSDLTYRMTLVRLRRTIFQAWASVSLVIDVIIAIAMVWSVRD